MKNLNFSKVNIFLIFVCVLGGIMCGGSVGWAQQQIAPLITVPSLMAPVGGDGNNKGETVRQEEAGNQNKVNGSVDNNAAAAAAAETTNAPNGVTPTKWKEADEALTTINPTSPSVIFDGTCPIAEQSINEVNETIKSCKSKSSLAAHACLGAFSPILQKAVAGIGGAVALADTAMSFSKTCSKLKDALKIGDMALTAYNAACTGMSLLAKSSCKKMIEAMNKNVTALEIKEKNSTAAVSCRATKEEISLRIPHGTNLSKINDDYKWNMVAAGIGLVGIAKNMFMTKKCEEKTEDESNLNCAEGSTDPLCSYVTMDCTSKKDQNKVECICKNKPNAAGCSGSNITDLGNGGSNSLERTPINTNTIQTPSSTNLTSGFDGAKSLAGQNTGGGSTGGGLNGADTTKGFGGGNLKDKEAVKSKITATGASDLSGGGGGSSGSGGGYADAEYKAYVRGGAKDPHRDVAGFGSQVTGSGGKSNWEKVSDRYKINRTSLIDQ